MRVMSVHLLLLVVFVLAYLHIGDTQAADSNNILLYNGDSPNITAYAATPATNIIGRDGLCVDVTDDRYNDGNPIGLSTCVQQRRQLWTFHSDGTIRSNGKCLTTYGYSVGSYIMIYNCLTAATEATRWALDFLGTITNPQSGLVLTARTATPGTILTLNEDSNSSTQAWTVENYTPPSITYIFGFTGNKCWQANSVPGDRLSLENCVVNGREIRQQWALYGDKTIRVFSNRTLCVTSNGHSIMDNIIISSCQGIGNQRWSFTGNGPIFNPNAGLVMQSDASLQYIFLYPISRMPNYQWWFVF